MSKAAASKAKYRVLRPISYKGERVERGTVLDLDEKGLDEINPAYIEAVKAEKAGKKVQEDAGSDKEPAAGDVKEPAEGSDIDV